MWYILITIVMSLVLVFYWIQKRKVIEMSNVIKSDLKAVPLLGHAYMFIGDSHDRMSALQTLGRQAIKHDGLTKLWLGPRFLLTVADPKAAEPILKNCLDKDELRDVSKIFLGNASVIAPVPTWRRRRKIANPTFGQKNLNRFVKVFSEQSGIMVRRLQAVAGLGPFSIWNYFESYNMDTVCETTLGIQLQAQSNPDEPFLKASKTVSDLIAARLCQPWLQIDFFYRMLPAYRKLKGVVDIIHDFVDMIVKSKMNNLRTGAYEHNNLNGSKSESMQSTDGRKSGVTAFLDLLIESSSSDQGYTDIELREETLMMLIAGTDTSAVAMAFTLVLLSNHSDVQEKVYDELKEVFGDSTRPVQLEDLPHLKYLEVVIKESLRLYPPVPVIVRKADNNLVLPSGLAISDGTRMILHIWAIHRNPRYWGEDAELFRPERFLDDALQHPAQFMPFSYGPRNCIEGVKSRVCSSGIKPVFVLGSLNPSLHSGLYITLDSLGPQYAMLSMKTALATILRRYRVLPASTPGLSPDTKRENPSGLRLKFEVTMKDVDNFIMKFKSRN